MVLKAIKVRLYPNKEQKQLLNNHFGSCRFIYNAALEYKKTMYRDFGIKMSKFDLMKELVDVKQDSNFIWLNETKAECLQNVMDALDSAFKGFYKGKGYPKFKSKKSKQSFLQKQSLKISNVSNKLVFLGHKIKFKCSEQSAWELRTSKIKRITYSKDKTNQYFASILIEFEPNKFPESNKEIGLDLGLKTYAVTSAGEFIDNPKFYRKSEQKLITQQRKLSKKKKGSKNFEKQRLKVAKLHKKITNQKEYFLHNLSKKLLYENQVIAIEDLSVKNMIQNHNLAKSIADASWSRFTNMLVYKSKWYGREVRIINRFAASSKTCSCCGWINENLTLADRTFDCQKCGLVIDRDLNAAINIMNFSKNEIINREECSRINASGDDALVSSVNEEEKLKNLIL